jgi:D-alanyl-D-alanine carboxypeptidase
MKKYISVVIVSVLLVNAAAAQSTADSLLYFIKNNKSKAALYLVQNDVVLAQLNESKIMPLASTVKILVALEFAKQAGQNVFKKDKRVPVKDLNKYYLPDTDGGAHPAWLAYERSRKHLQNDSVALIDVARGMIMFSSNANTEYLMELLGLDNINNNLHLLGVTRHTAVYPLVASLYMYQNPRNKTEESILKSISKLSDKQYGQYIYAMHKALTYDTALKAKFRPQDLSLKMQKLWSDRLPASTVKDYAQIVNVINNRKYFDKGTYNVLSQILETVMENPANQEWIEHAGMKGGSTAWVLTKALYATLKNNDRIELAYFFNDLTPAENIKLQGWMNSFELKILSDKAFRETIARTF